MVLGLPRYVLQKCIGALPLAHRAVLSTVHSQLYSACRANLHSIDITIDVQYLGSVALFIAKNAPRIKHIRLAIHGTKARASRNDVSYRVRVLGGMEDVLSSVSMCHSLETFSINYTALYAINIDRMLVSSLTSLRCIRVSGAPLDTEGALAGVAGSLETLVLEDGYIPREDDTNDLFEGIASLVGLRTLEIHGMEPCQIGRAHV